MDDARAAELLEDGFLTAVMLEAALCASPAYQAPLYGWDALIADDVDARRVNALTRRRKPRRKPAPPVPSAPVPQPRIVAFPPVPLVPSWEELTQSDVRAFRQVRQPRPQPPVVPTTWVTEEQARRNAIRANQGGCLEGHSGPFVRISRMTWQCERCRRYTTLPELLDEPFHGD